MTELYPFGTGSSQLCCKSSILCSCNHASLVFPYAVEIFGCVWEYLDYDLGK